MASKYGGSVYERNRYYPWDWGQALARECYGENWNSVVPDNPTRDDVSRAQLWENGDWPSWVDVERMNSHFTTNSEEEQ